MGVTLTDPTARGNLAPAGLAAVGANSTLMPAKRVSNAGSTG